MYRSYILLMIALIIGLALPGAPPVIETSTTHAQADGFLILNEISPWPADGRVWVELMNPSDEPVELAGWTVEFLSGFSCEFPDSAHEVAGGAIHVLDIAGGNPLNPEGDACVLRDPSGPIDAIRWGHLPEGTTLPIAAGAPLWPPYGVIPEDGLFHADDVLIRIPETWPPSAPNWVGSRHWVYRSGEEATRGDPNPPPGPVVMTPGDGARLASAFGLGVLGLEWTQEITFQVARDDAFDDIVIEETTEGRSITIDDLPAGIYYWRVRGDIDQPGAWSRAQQFEVLPYDVQEMIEAAERDSGVGQRPSVRRTASAKGGLEPPEGLPVFPGEELVAFHVIGCTHLVQRKDTEMVCLDGCPLSGADSWQDPHYTTYDHGRMYCSRACLAMIGSLAPCGTLSQDRVTYYIFEEARPPTDEGTETGHLDDPFGDLGHNIGTWNWTSRRALEWIYGQPAGTATEMMRGADSFDDGDSSDMDSIREFVDDDRPVLRLAPTHLSLIDGYAVVNDIATSIQTYIIRVLDPAHETPFDWVHFETGSIVGYMAPPRTGRPMRCDEPEVSTDSDGDMLVDFDEIHRLGTDPNNVDTDGDALDDMVDMYGYLFDELGNFAFQERDFDGDGDPKETDPDNDRPGNDGVNDGCEDINLNGFFDTDGSESDNFNAEDDFSVISRFCYNGYIHIESRTTGGGFPELTVTTEEMVIIELDQPTSSDEYIYRHTWELHGTPIEMRIPSAPGFPGGVIRSVSEGEGTGLARISIEVDDEGHYRMVTDCEPRLGSYTIRTTGPGTDRTTNEDWHLAIGDHHYQYVSPETPPVVFEWLESIGPANVFEGDVITMPDGSTRIAGSDTIGIPEAIGGPNLTGTATRSWEIWIAREEGS